MAKQKFSAMTERAKWRERERVAAEAAHLPLAEPPLRLHFTAAEFLLTQTSRIKRPDAVVEPLGVVATDGLAERAASQADRDIQALAATTAVAALTTTLLQVQKISRT